MDQLTSLKRSQVDGIVLVPAAESNVEKVCNLMGKTPIVAFDRPLGNSIDSVTLHNRLAGRQATEHLLWHSHQRIVAIIAPYKLQPLEARLRGYKDAMDEAGHRAETILYQDESQLQSDLWHVLRRKRAPATAILSMSYSVTIAILAALQNCKIPLREVGFVGIDDLEFASFLNPSLTTVAQPVEQFAQLAFERLMHRIGGSEDAAARIALPPLLVVRSSCGCKPE
jgi:LacI family transcriptional regulator